MLHAEQRLHADLSSCELGEHLQEAEGQQQEAEKQQECSRCQGAAVKAHQELR